MTGSKPKSGYFRSGLPYNRLGEGPRPLVVFQGLLFENKPQAGMLVSGYKFLEADYTVYVVLRKPDLPAGCTLKDMADDYARMIEDEFGGPLDVIGVSTGGSIAHHFAADHPDLVRRLIIHSSAYTLSDSAKRLQLQVGRAGGTAQMGAGVHADAGRTDAQQRGDEAAGQAAHLAGITGDGSLRCAEGPVLPDDHGRGGG